jgi:hypothetical protein
MAFCVMTKSAAISQKSVSFLRIMLSWVNWDVKKIKINDNWMKQGILQNALLHFWLKNRQYGILWNVQKCCYYTVNCCHFNQNAVLGELG